MLMERHTKAACLQRIFCYIRKKERKKDNNATVAMSDDKINVLKKDL